jgi:beta-1,3-galactosyltransferase 1
MVKPTGNESNDGKNANTGDNGTFIPDQPKHRPWLAAVICAASDTEHRRKIRETWMHLYRDIPFDGRFVVANPGPKWTSRVAWENRTFGDMIVLDHVQEDDITANTVKTLEFYTWLVNHSPQKYEFVSKLDTDLWLNARGFWERFLAPRLQAVNSTTRENQLQWRSTVERTVIGELYYARKSDLVFPHGSMYTVTWDMLGLLSGLQDVHQVVTGEDMAVAMLLLKARERANFVNFRGSEKFNYDDRDARDDTAWARDETHPDAVWHALVGRDPIAVHQLKTERLWGKVAACFDEGGIKVVPPPLSPDDEPEEEEEDGERRQLRNRTPRRTPPLSLQWLDFWSWTGLGHPFQSRFDMIPDFFRSMDEEGNWIYDGIWNLGKTKEGWNGDRLKQVAT